MWLRTTLEDVTDEGNFLRFEAETSTDVDGTYGEIVQMVECADKENLINLLFHVTTEDIIIEGTKDSSSTEIQSNGDESDNRKKDCYTLSDVMQCHILHSPFCTKEDRQLSSLIFAWI
ncbi:hypothetical protein PR048_001657, partial [Dryococelus australis]